MFGVILAASLAVLLVVAAFVSPLVADRLERRQLANRRAAELAGYGFPLGADLDAGGLDRGELYAALADRLRVDSLGAPSAPV